MTSIKATCPTCGDVELTADDVRLVVCSVEAWSYYAFTCSSCGEEVRKPAPADVTRLLRIAKVREERWAVPAEALEPRAGAPIGYDDVLDAVLWLATHDCLAEAVAA